MFYIKLKTFLKLGITNILRVVWYRLSVKLNLNPVRRITHKINDSRFFKVPETLCVQELCCNTQWINQHTYFGWYEVHSLDIPNWHQNPFNQKVVDNPIRPWWQISDFDLDIGDIKTVWEASRFDWTISFAQKVAQGDITYIEKLNHWINDWIEHNPFYCGVNWKCGQEASIRVMHLALSAILLDQTTDSNDVLLSLVEGHLKRIVPTIGYAIAQDNNHGTSEAAALYIGGSWLMLNGHSHGSKWYEMGKKWLNNRAKRLIMADGSFSQYSVNYHRVMLDTYNLVDIWCLRHDLPKLDSQTYDRLKLATSWLYTMVQAESGDVPNIGANDGARLIPLSATDYRDFRPTVQLAAVLFHSKSAYSTAGAYDLPLNWLGVSKPKATMPKVVSINFPKGGYCVLKNERAFVLIKYPVYKFRPSQSDLLHVDVWVDGQNILSDSGSFSYNHERSGNFSSVNAHNTIAFGDHNQMPKINRFLWGGWPTAHVSYSKLAGEEQLFDVRYTDFSGNTHQRAIQLSQSQLIIKDVIETKEKAILRWHINSGLTHNISGQRLNIPSAGLSLMLSNSPLSKLDTSFQSRYYLHETTMNCIATEVKQAETTTLEF